MSKDVKIGWHLIINDEDLANMLVGLQKDMNVSIKIQNGKVYVIDNSLPFPRYELIAHKMKYIDDSHFD